MQESGKDSHAQCRISGTQYSDQHRSECPGSRTVRQGDPAGQHDTWYDDADLQYSVPDDHAAILFNNYYLQYKSSFPGISRLVRFLETETENTAPCPDKPHFETLALRNVSYSYVEGQCALKDFSLEIRSGDKLILTGDNMTGKSTLLKLLAGLLTADRGQLLVDGKESADHELRDLATLFLQNQDSYCYFDQEGSGGEVQLMNLSIMRDVSSPLILLDEADASINRSRLDEVYQFSGFRRDCHFGHPQEYSAHFTALPRSEGDPYGGIAIVFRFMIDPCTSITASKPAAPPRSLRSDTLARCQTRSCTRSAPLLRGGAQHARRLRARSL